MRTRRDTLELLAIFLITAVAGFIRFLHLGAIPLSDSEANLALQALHLSTNASNFVGGDVLLTNFSAFMMMFFADGEWAARLLSAISGTLLVLVPFLFRKKMSTKVLLVISIWLTFDPGMVAMSRQVNSTIIAILLAVLLVYMVENRSSIGIGIVAGLLFLSGTTFWLGFITFVLALLIHNRIQKSAEIHSTFFEIAPLFNSKMIVSFGVTILFGGTLFFLFPGQLAGIMTGFLGLFQRPTLANRVEASSMLRMLLFYQLPLVILGIVGLVNLRSAHKKLAQILSLWFLFLLMTIVLLPGTTLDWVLWLEVPLILSGSVLLANYLALRKEDLNLVALVSGIGLAIFAFLILIYFNLTTNPESILKNPETGQALIIAGVALLIVAFFLVGWALSWRIAARSLFIIFVSFSVIYSLSASWNAARLRQPYQNEMWSLDPTPIEADLLFRTLEDYSLWNHGNNTAGEIVVVDIPSPALRFLLRDFNKVEYVKNLTSSVNPEMIITNADSELAMADSYRGQDFSFTSRPNWNLLIPGEWRAWILTRQIPRNLTDTQQYIVWVRNDLFPGSK